MVIDLLDDSDNFVQHLTSGNLISPATSEIKIVMHTALPVKYIGDAIYPYASQFQKVT